MGARLFFDKLTVLESNFRQRTWARLLFDIFRNFFKNLTAAVGHLLYPASSTNVFCISAETGVSAWWTSRRRSETITTSLLTRPVFCTTPITSAGWFSDRGHATAAASTLVSQCAWFPFKPIRCRLALFIVSWLCLQKNRLLWAKFCIRSTSLDKLYAVACCFRETFRQALWRVLNAAFRYAFAAQWVVHRLQREKKIFNKGTNLPFVSPVFVNLR